MAAGLGFKTFNTGDVLSAADVNGYLMQGVWVFASSAARTSAVSSPQEGNVSFLKDTNSLEIYDGAAWVAYGAGDITGVTAGTGISGGGTSGAVTITNSMATAIDAKGDLIVGTGADTFDRLAVGGTNGHVLTVDSSTSTGLKWAAAAGGGALTLLSTTTLSGTSTAITSISGSYTHLYVIVYGAVWPTDNAKLRVAPNGSTTESSYVRTSYLQTTAAAASGGGVNGYYFMNSGANKLNSSTANVWTLEILNYASTALLKPMRGTAAYIDGNSTDAVEMNAGWYQSTSAVSSLTFTNDGGYSFSAGTVLVYGVN